MGIQNNGLIQENIMNHSNKLDGVHVYSIDHAWFCMLVLFKIYMVVNPSAEFKALAQASSFINVFRKHEFANMSTRLQPPDLIPCFTRSA